MAFIKKKTSEADREFIDSFHFINPVTNEKRHPRYWTIDQERNIFLIGLGGQGYYASEIPMFSALIWNKCVIMLETFSSSIKNDSGVKECFWKITKIKAPICLLEKSDEMIEIIKQNFLWKRIISFIKISEKIHDSIL